MGKDWLNSLKKMVEQNICNSFPAETGNGNIKNIDLHKT